MSQIINIAKLNNKGQGVGLENPKILLWNSLPGEEVEYDNLKGKKGTKEGVAISILKKSPHRIEPEEPDHFLSCSPLQILDINSENQFKLESFKSKFNEHGIDLVNTDIVCSEQIYGYRNKMEYSFYVDENDSVSISFFKRGSHKGKIAIKECKLAHPSINSSAKKIIDWINKEKISGWDLKSLILRSNRKGECIAGLYSKTKFIYETLPELDKNLIGFSIYYSDPQSPASKPTEELVNIGQSFLEEQILDKKFKFGLNSFFQINCDIFEGVIRDIKKEINTEDQIIDMYSGVGSIGISLANNIRTVKLVEVVNEANDFAIENLRINNINNIEPICTKSELAANIITQDSVLIVDPPREGLHKDLIKSILEIKPKKIVYLSCNPLTQIENLEKLIDEYEISFSRFYNFFPRTVHLESLIILNRKYEK